MLPLPSHAPRLMGSAALKACSGVSPAAAWGLGGGTDAAWGRTSSNAIQVPVFLIRCPKVPGLSFPFVMSPWMGKMPLCPFVLGGEEKGVAIIDAAQSNPSIMLLRPLLRRCCSVILSSPGFSLLRTALKSASSLERDWWLHLTRVMSPLYVWQGTV